MLIIKSQLNNGVNCNINFQKKKDSIVNFLLEISMWKFPNPKLTILRDFAEERFPEICQESTK